MMMVHDAMVKTTMMIRQEDMIMVVFMSNNCYYNLITV